MARPEHLVTANVEVRGLPCKLRATDAEHARKVACNTTNIGVWDKAGRTVDAEGNDVKLTIKLAKEVEAESPGEGGDDGDGPRDATS